MVGLVVVAVGAWRWLVEVRSVGGRGLDIVSGGGALIHAETLGDGRPATTTNDAGNEANDEKYDKENKQGTSSIALTEVG